MTSLLEAIAGLEVEIHSQAVASLGDTVEHMTGPQRDAAILAAKLDILGGELDYSHTRLKAELLGRLESGELWRYHPSSPNTFAELLQDRGISKSEASDLIAWEIHVYPYLLDRFDWHPFQVWGMLDKSKRRKLTPYLRDILDEEHHTPSQKVRDGVDRLFEIERQRVLGEAMAQWAHDYSQALKASVAVTPDWAEIGRKLVNDEAVSEEEEALLYDTYVSEHLPDYDEIAEVVKRLIETASLLTVRDLGEHVSPEPTPGIEGVLIRHQVVGEVTYQVVLTLTEDQLALLRRRFPDRLSLTPIEGAVIQETKTACGEAE